MKRCRMRIGAFLIGSCVATVVWASPLIAAPLVLPRPGQIGIGVQGQYGTLLKSGVLGSDFNSGAGVAVRLRYRMRYERGLGLSFESQSFDVRPGARFTDFEGNEIPPDSAIAPERLHVITAGVEVYQLFGTRTRTAKLLSLGAGIVQPRVRLRNDEDAYPNDGLFLSAGAGIENFFYRSWAWDVSTRYMAVFQDKKVNHDLQFSAGVIFYASY